MKKKLASTKKKKSSESFPIVAIGGSAGAIEAITQLLKNLSPDTGMAFVYVQHLDPTHESMLGPILSKATAMKVSQIEENAKLEPNHVYVCPPGKEMTIQDHNIKLHPLTARPVLHSPIDRLFFSVAENQKKGAIGIVLSGSASDGAAGLKAIRSAGGLTFAQDSSAKFQSMPKAALAENAVDLVLSPSEMAKELDRLSKNSDLLETVMNDIEAKNILPEDENLDEVFVVLKRAVGVDFSFYRKNTIRRRIVRRMLLHRFPTLKEYVQFLKQSAEESEALYRDLLINVTSFFREPGAMEYLKKSVLPRILKSKASDESIRVWVPGCSSGEEAYSIAILLMEVLGKKASNTTVRIFATDLSETAITKARAGIYAPSELGGISPQRLQRYFGKTDGNYRIVKLIRDSCIFSQHNVFKDPPFSRIDLVSCSNLLIYLENVLQKKVIATFYYALNPNGYLMLGKSETVGGSQNLFAPLNKKYKIYKRKKDANGKAIMEMNFSFPEWEKLPAPGQHRVIPKENNREKSLESFVDNLLLKSFIPPSVVVNQDLEILQFKGSTGLFLEPSPGKASLNLLKMARPGLGFELKNAVHKVIKSGEAYSKAGLEVKYDNKIHWVNIEVMPISIASNGSVFLIVFRESMPFPIESLTKGNSAKDKRIKQLEKELMASREDMRSIVEAQEAVNEELQSANEEVVSSNKELQSINEELETSKEEIESTNEELMTINRELQERNEQLADAQEYSSMIISTILEAVIVLDKDLRVVSANQTFYKNFHCKPKDTEGRLFFELGNGQWNVPDLQKVLEDASPEKNEYVGCELTLEFPTIGKKTLTFSVKKINRKSTKQQLTFLAIEDITEKEAAAKIIAESEAWFRNVADNSPTMIWVAGPDKLRTFVNKTWLEYTGRKVEQEIGSGWMENVYKDDLGSLLKIIDTSYHNREPYQVEYRLRRHDGEYRWIMATGKPTFSTLGSFSGFIGACHEVHDQRIQNEELEKKVKERTYELTQALEKEKELNELKSRFVTTASHEFRTPLTTVLTSIYLLEQYHGDKFEEEKKKHFERIKSSIQILKEILNDFLSLEKLEQKKVNVKEESFNLEEEINTILKGIDGVLKSNQKLKYVHVGTKVVTQDKNIVRNILLNLVSNASKFSPDGKEIEITTDVGDKKITLSVKDAGIGIPPEEQKNIFEKFYRAKNAGTIQGTGLGLNIVKRYAELLGGTIHFTSKMNEGSTFTVEIPVTNSN